MSASISNFLGLLSLFSAAVGVAFFFAALKIKDQIALEVQTQISNISESQLRGQFEDSRLAQLLLDLQKEIDKNKAEIIQLRRELDQIVGFLVSKGFLRRGQRFRSEGEEQL